MVFVMCCALDAHGECFLTIFPRGGPPSTTSALGGETGPWNGFMKCSVSGCVLAEGRDASPSGAIVDSQSVKTTEKGGLVAMMLTKKVCGRKRHIVVDTTGLLLTVVVHPANIQDRDGARLALMRLVGRFPPVEADLG